MLIHLNPLELPILYFVLPALVNELCWVGHEILLFISCLAWLGERFTLSSVRCLCWSQERRPSLHSVERNGGLTVHNSSYLFSASMLE